jgi:hypothetical protein
MKFDTKIAIVLREDLPTWQEINMTAFLASGIASKGDFIGADYVAVGGRRDRPMFRQPVVILVGSAEELRAACNRAQTRRLAMAIFTEPLFATGHDEANRAAFAASPPDQMSIAGFGMNGPKNDIDRALKGLKLVP